MFIQVFFYRKKAGSYYLKELCCMYVRGVQPDYLSVNQHGNGHKWFAVGDDPHDHAA